MRPPLHALAPLLAAALFAASSDAALRWTQVAASGDPVPGEDATTFDSIWAIGLTDDETVVLQGAYRVADGPLFTAFYTWTRDGSLARLAPDTLAPTLDMIVNTPGARVAPDGGVVVFDGLRVLSCHVGLLTCATIASRGDPVAGLDGAEIASVRGLEALPNGGGAFAATLQLPENQSRDAVFVSDGSTLARIATSGDAMPGAPAETIDAPFAGLGRCADGIAFDEALVPPPAPPPPYPPDHLLRWSAPGGLSAVLHPEGTAPEGPAGWPFGFLAIGGRLLPNPPFTCDAGGTIAFRTATSDPEGGENPQPVDEIWTCPAIGDCSLRAMGGDPVPGRPATIFQRRDFTPAFEVAVIAVDGSVFFQGNTAMLVPAGGPILGEGLYESTAGSPIAVRVEAGDPVPSLPSATFTGAFVPLAASNGRLLFAADQSGAMWTRGLYVSEAGAPIYAMDIFVQGFAPTASLTLGGSDAALEHVVVNQITENSAVPPSSTTRALFAPVPEPGFASTAVTAIAGLALLARRR